VVQPNQSKPSFWARAWRAILENLDLIEREASDDEEEEELEEVQEERGGLKR
jgi:hypothetical protein